MGSAEHPSLLQPAPPGRTYESLLNHFNRERAIADRLRAADRPGRKQLYQTMYDELFRAVPDHPRLSRRDDTALTKRVNRTKSRLLRPFMRPDAVFLEFGAGDCRFSFEMAEQFREVHAVDIADQIGATITPPSNFTLTVYDGYNLALPDSSIDVAFSDQLIEHLHPEDTAQHFELLYRLLKPGGVYVLRTPHRLTGPHDVSRYFSERAQGFHLKEWTYGELSALLQGLGFSSAKSYWFGKGLMLPAPLFVIRPIEWAFARASYNVRRRLLPFLLPSLTMAVRK